MAHDDDVTSHILGNKIVEHIFVCLSFCKYKICSVRYCHCVFYYFKAVHKMHVIDCAFFFFLNQRDDGLLVWQKTSSDTILYRLVVVLVVGATILTVDGLRILASPPKN